MVFVTNDNIAAYISKPIVFYISMSGQNYQLLAIEMWYHTSGISQAQPPQISSHNDLSPFSHMHRCLIHTETLHFLEIVASFIASFIH